MIDKPVKKRHQFSPRRCLLWGEISPSCTKIDGRYFEIQSTYQLTQGICQKTRGTCVGTDRTYSENFLFIFSRLAANACQDFRSIFAA